MFKIQLKYKDFNDKEHVEDVYFHMMTPEFADLQFNPDLGGDLGKWVQDGIRSGDNSRIYAVFKLLVINSYGRRSEDGSRFIKRPEYTEEFMNSRAWEEFFLWLLDEKNAHKHATEFWDGIFPEAMRDRFSEVEKTNPEAKKLTELSKEELLELIAKKTAANEATA